MITKKCKGCGIEKSLSEFYKHRGMSDGHLSFCKDCVKAREHKYRIKNIERIREYDRNRPNKEKRYEKNKEYVIQNREKYNKYKNEWCKRNKHKRRAHNQVRRAILKGEIIKPLKCEKCGPRGKLHAHHSNYDDALNVIFLCHKCHFEEHKKINEIKRQKTL